MAEQRSKARHGAHLVRIIREAESFLTTTSDESPEALLEELQEQVQANGSDRERLDELAELIRLAGNPEKAESLSRDAEYRLDISDDAMSMMLAVDPPIAGGKPVTVHDVVDKLKQMGVRAGVDLKAIEEAVNQAAQGTAVENVVIVRGKEPEAPTPEQRQLYARVSHDEELEPVTWDELTRDRQPICMCCEGDLILTITPPGPGKAGYNVRSETLPPPPCEVEEITVGAYVERDADHYYATATGRVTYDGSRLEVHRVMLIPRDVLRDDGAVKFDGEIYVRGAVRSGATVHATGDITVDGLVEDATIVSAEGSVQLQRGVTGRNRGSITAASDIYTRFAENATLYAGGSIYVEVGSINSRLTAGNAVMVVQGRGQCLGGVILAGQRVEARQLGTESEIHTEVAVGIGGEAMKELAALDAAMAQAEDRHERAGEMADRLQRLVGDPSKLEGKQLDTFIRLRQVQFAMELKIRDQQARRNELLENAANEASDAAVIVHDSMMPGVLVRIGSATMTTQERQARCRVYRAAGRNTLSVTGI